MKRSILAALCLSSATAWCTDLLQPVADSLQGDWGRIRADVRYRYEYADEEGSNKQEGHASTMRLRLGYLTPNFKGFEAYAEMEGNWVLGKERYNSLRNDETKYSVVADPQEVELNQAWLSYTGIQGVLAKVGRQRITYDNHRFIGNVGWRQLEQTFDSVVIRNNLLPDTEIEVAFLWQVRGILSNTIQMTSPLLHLKYTGLPYGQVIAYGYWLDYDDRKDSRNFTLSSQTYGIRFIGDYPIGDRTKVLYTAEYARQMDFQRNPVDYATDYYHFMGGLSFYGITLQGDIENLTADNRIGFSTPLSTLHAFQGWTDKFLVTPANGVRDVYATVAVKLWGAKLMGVYHDFQDENGGERYGEEYDALLTRKFGRHFSVLLKYAYYNARGFSTDTQKVWGQVAMHF